MEKKAALREKIFDRLDWKSFPVGGPNYKPVTGAELSRTPYNLIARVCVRWSASDHQPVGSAWLMKGGVLVTCAHVCPRGHNFVATFPGGATEDVEPVIFPEYGDRRLDRGDLAVLTGPSLWTDGLALRTEADGGSIEVAGYPENKREMVRHSGKAVRHENWFIHSAHTAVGQSGAPIIQGNVVIGMHLGPAEKINSYRQGTYTGEPPGANAALVFTDNHAAFLKRFVQQPLED